MAKTNRITSCYKGDGGSFTTKDGAVHAITRDSNPYQYLIGALSGCFYYTFADVARSMDVSYESVEIEVSCTKREVLPTTMDKCSMDITAHGVTDPIAFAEAIEKTCSCCSIYYTISQVAEISYSIEFA